MTDKKKAIYVTATIPDRYGIGIQQRAYRNLNLLTERFNVDLIILGSNESPIKTSDLRLNSVIWLSANFYKDVPKALARIPGAYFAWRILNILGFAILIRKNSSRLQKELSEYRQSNYAYGFFFRIRTGWFFDFLSRKMGCRLGHAVIDFDDIESAAKKRSLNITREKRGYQKYLSELVEMELAARQEHWCLKKFDSVWVCSQVDQKKLRLVQGISANVVVMPNTVYLPNQLASTTGTCSILLLGAMNYFPNIDAAQFFCYEVLPTLNERMNSKMQFYIVGASPEEDVLNLDSIEGVNVTGRVESVQDYYKKADIVVVPIRFGGGTRIKILEAMAFGRVVISTTIGAEGLGVTDGKELIIADDPEEYVSACYKLLNQPDLRHEIERNAQKFVRENFSFDLARSKFNQETREVF